MLFRSAIIILAGGLIYYFTAEPVYNYVSDEISWASCDSLEGAPAHEQEFATAICATLNDLRSIESELRRENLEEALDGKLCQLVDGRPANSWRGTIRSIDETLVTNSIALSVELSSKILLSTDSGVLTKIAASDNGKSETATLEADVPDEEAADTGLFGIKKPELIDSVIPSEFPDLNFITSTHIGTDHPIYDELKKLDVSDDVLFSGSFVTRAESKNCMKHANTFEFAKLLSGEEAVDYWFDFSDIELR